MLSLPLLLRLNAASCLVFGVVFVLFAGPTATFLGTPPVWLLIVLGAGLIVNGLHLAWASTRDQTWLAEVLYFSSADVLWVLLTLGLVMTGTFLTSGPGIAVALIVAIGVGALGVLQAMAVQT